MNATSLLQEVLDDLPADHQERPGLIRALELIRSYAWPGALASDLRTWHDNRQSDCCAFSEGQRCCVDDWLDA